MKTLVLVEPISSGKALLQAARNLNFQIISIFVQPIEILEKALHIDTSKITEQSDYFLFSSNFAEILAWLRSLNLEIAGVVGASEPGVDMANRLAAELSVYTNRIEFFKAHHNKGEMRKVLLNSGLSCPAFAICETEEQVKNFIETHSFPLIIKTPIGALTSHVYYCETEQTLLAHFHDILETRDLFGGQAINVIIEEYIGGSEYVVDTFSDGTEVHITDIWIYEKISLGEVKNIYYNVLSLPIDTPLLEPIKEYALKIARAFGIERGPAHIELKDDPIRGPTLIEIGVRLAGAQIPYFINQHSNFPIFESTIEVFTKEKIPFPDPYILFKHFAIAMCPLLKSGKVIGCEGIAQIERLPSFEFHTFHLEIGRQTPPSYSVATTPLIVYLAHENREQLLHDVRAVHDLFIVHLE